MQAWNVWFQFNSRLWAANEFFQLTVKRESLAFHTPEIADESWLVTLAIEVVQKKKNNEKETSRKVLFQGRTLLLAKF